MTHVVHWKQGEAEGTVEQDCWPTQAVARQETKRILADGYGLTKARITEVEVYGDGRHHSTHVKSCTQK